MNSRDYLRCVENSSVQFKQKIHRIDLQKHITNINVILILQKHIINVT